MKDKTVIVNNIFKHDHYDPHPGMAQHLAQ